MNNSSRNNLVVKNTMMLYIRMFLTMAVTLYTSRIVLQALGEVNYGVYNVVAGVVVMMDFINAALYGASIRFMTYVMESGDLSLRKRIFSSIRFVHLAIGILTLMLGETVGLWFVSTQLNIPQDSVVPAFWAYQCSLVVLFTSEISLPYSALIMAHERMSAFAYITILEVFLKLGIAFAVMYAPFNSLIFYSVLFMCVQLVMRVVYTLYCNRKFEETKEKIKYHKEDVRSIGKFTGWTVLGSTSSMISTQGVNILLNIFFGPLANTARGIAAQVQTACVKFCSNFQVAVKPQIIKSYSTGELARMHSLLLYSLKICLFLTLIIVVPLFLFTPELLRIWLSKFPDNTVFFVRIILIQQLLRSLGYPIISAIEATGRIKKYQIIISVINIFTIPVAYIALKYGKITADTVMLIYLAFTALVEAARVFVILPEIKMKYHTYFKRIISYSITPAIMFVLAYRYLPIASNLNIFELAGNCIIACVITCGVLYVLGFNIEERRKINGYLLKAIKKIRH